MELLQAEVRRWAVGWDVIGLAETWLDEESEKGLTLQGFSAVCASRKQRGGWSGSASQGWTDLPGET